jgi:hypothetical protein
LRVLVTATQQIDEVTSTLVENSIAGTEIDPQLAYGPDIAGIAS